MKTHALAIVTGVVLVLGAACGGSTSSNGGTSTGGSGATGGSGTGGATGGTGGTGNAAGTGGVDCSRVGCAPPPMCDTGCQDVCGCCACGEGSTVPAEGGYLLCVGGCYKFVAGGATCGGFGGKPCGPDEFCDYPASSYCGGDDSTGYCVKKPSVCDASCPGVCGCDGEFYCNECMAQSAGTDASQSTSCMADGGVGKLCGSDSECSPGLKCCYPCGVPGCQNQCTQPGPDGQCIPVP